MALLKKVLCLVATGNASQEKFMPSYMNTKKQIVQKAVYLKFMPLKKYSEEYPS